MKTNLEALTDYCKNYITENLPECVGRDICGCELGCTVTERINADGSCTYDTELAKDYIKNWFDEAGEFLDYELTNFGENKYNPFEEPESFMVCMVIEGINSLLSQSDFVNSFWDDKTKLTKKMVTTILKEISDKEVYF